MPFCICSSTRCFITFPDILYRYIIRQYQVLVKDYLHDLHNLHSTYRSLLKNDSTLCFEFTFQPFPHILPIVFRKMTFTSHLIFTSLGSIILRWFLTTFCSCFMFCLLSFSKRSLFFVLILWYYTWCFMNFFVGKNVFSHPLQLCVHHFSRSWQWFATLNTCYGTWCFMNFSKSIYTATPCSC